MQLSINADTPETVRNEISRYLSIRAEQLRSVANITDNRFEKEMANASADAVAKLAEEVSGIQIVDLSKPQDFASFEEMYAVAKERAGKGVMLKNNGDLMLFGMSYQDGRMLFLNGITSITEGDARMVFKSIKDLRPV